MTCTDFGWVKFLRSNVTGKVTTTI